MTRIETIEKEIESLPAEDFRKLREWFSNKDLDLWDREIEADSSSGTLNFLVREAAEEKKYGKLRDL